MPAVAVAAEAVAVPELKADEEKISVVQKRDTAIDVQQKVRRLLVAHAV